MATGKTTFKYDKDGNLVAYRDGKRVGNVGGTGDAVPKRKSTSSRKKK